MIDHGQECRTCPLNVVSPEQHAALFAARTAMRITPQGMDWREVAQIHSIGPDNRLKWTALAALTISPVHEALVQQCAENFTESPDQGQHAVCELE